MKDNFLSQEEIDSLIKKNKEVNNSENLERGIVGILSEITSVVMEGGKTSLSTILGIEVNITDHQIEEVEIKDIKLANNVYLDYGLKGEGFSLGFILDSTNAIKIANSIMGGNNEDLPEEPSEVHMGVISKVLNQMILSGYNPILSSSNITLNNLTQGARLLKDKFSIEGLSEDTVVVKISSKLEIDGLLRGTITQILTMDYIEKIISLVLQEENNVEDTLSQELSNDEIAATLDSRERLAVLNPSFSKLKESKNLDSPKNLDLILDVPMEFSVVLGKIKKSIKEILSLSPGSIVDLEKFASEPVEIYVNDKLIAQGEVVVIDDNFGVRITNILSAAERVKKLR